MKKLLIASTIVTCGTFPLAAYAASQGSLGATSTATFGVTATGPVTAPQVQILNVADMSITNSTRAEIDATNPGASFPFCVVNTNGGGVTLQLTNSSGFLTTGWRLEPSAGPVPNYRVSVRPLDNSSELGGSAGGSASFSATVSAGTPVTSAAACGVSNNLKMHAVLAGQMIEAFPAYTYTSTVTVVASPI